MPVPDIPWRSPLAARSLVLIYYMVALHYIYITRFTSILDTFYNILQCYTQTHYTYTYLLEPQTHYTVTLQGVR